MGSLRLMVWGLVSGLATSAIVTFWPETWTYAPGIIFGATLAGSFVPDIFKTKLGLRSTLKIFGFLAISIIAYRLALAAAEWVLGASGFATFASYASPAAESALYVATFVGGCIGSSILSAGIRLLFFRFNLIRGIFIFAIAAGALGSIITVGFEAFGFIPQFLFPVWHLGMTAVIMYLYKNEGKMELAEEEGNK